MTGTAVLRPSETRPDIAASTGRRAVARPRVTGRALVMTAYLVFLMVPIYWLVNMSLKTNMEITRTILSKLNKPESLIRYVQDRPGHDKRYAIDAAKMKRELGWEPRYTFETGIDQTIQWFLANEAWWRPLKQRGLDAQRAQANQTVKA